MAYRAGSAFIAIAPSFRGFQSEIKAEAAKIRAIEVDVKPVVSKTAEAKADTELARTARTRTANVKVDVDTSRARRAIAGLRSSLDRLAKGRFLISLGVAAAPLAAPVGAAALGGGLALGSVAAAGGLGAGAFAGVAGSEVSRLQAAQKAGTPLSASQKSAAAAISGLQAQWNAFLTSMESPVFSALGKGITVLVDGLKPLQSFLTPVAKAMGGLFDQIDRAVKSKGFQAWAKSFGIFAGKTLKDAGPVLINVAKGLGGLLTAFQPLGASMLRQLGPMTAKFAAWAQGLGKSSGFHQFIAYVKTNGPVLLSTLGSLVKAIVDVAVALAPLAAKMLVAVGSFARWLSATAKAHPRLIQIAGAVAVFAAGLSLVAKPLSKVIEGVRLFAIGFRILSAAMLANPIGLIIAGLILLGVGLVMLYKKSATFRAIVQGTWKAIKAAALATFHWFMNVLIPFFTTTLPGAFTTAWKWVSKRWGQITGFITDKAMSVWHWLTGTFVPFFTKTIPGAFFTALHWVQARWGDATGFITDKAKAVWHWVTGTFVPLFTVRIPGAFSTANRLVIQKLSELKTKITGAFSHALTMLSSAGKNIIHGLTSGISSAMRGIKDWLRDHVWDPIVSGVKSLFGIHSPSTVFEGFGLNMIRGLINGLIKGNAGSFVSKIFGGVSDNAGKALSWLVGKGKVAWSALTGLGSKAWGFLSGLFGGSTGGSGVQRWSGLVSQALGLLGQSQSLVPAVLARMSRESGGNPKAINLWDVNAKNGTPSKGLMQVIGPTFAAFAGPFAGRGILDPFANIYAGLNYALHAYPSLAFAMGKPGGYAAGTMNAAPGLAWVGERGPELVRFRGGEQVLSNAQSQGFGDVYVSIDPKDLDGIRSMEDFVAMARRRARMRSGMVTVG